MPLPTPPRGDPLDDVILAWADATAHLAATLRNVPLEPPQLTVVPRPRWYAVELAIAATAAWCFVRAYQHAATLRLAFEVHPIYGKGVLWACAAGAGLAWRLYDRLKLYTLEAVTR